MGRQVRFEFGDDDVARLEDYLRSVDAAFIPRWTDSPDLAPQGDLAAPTGLRGLPPLIIRVADIDRARREWTATPLAEPPSPGHWALDRTTVPVIDYMRGTGEGPLGYGRLQFEVATLIGGRMVPVDPAFVRWADHILGWVRHQFRYDAGRQLYLGWDRPATG
jgi:hypothetical protein